MNKAPLLEPTNIRLHRTKLVTKAPGARDLCTPILNNFITLFWNVCSYSRWLYNGFAIPVQWLCLKSLGPFNKRVMLISYMHIFKTSFNIILSLQFTCRSSIHFITTVQIQTTFILRTALFWFIKQRVLVIPYRGFGTTYWSYLQGRF
jgi:hypothetical protein